MSVFERTQEIGILKAIGASRVDIFKLVWIETTCICFFGSILGCILALIGTNLIELILKNILPYSPAGKLILISPQLLVGAFVGAVGLGLVSGVYPVTTLLNSSDSIYVLRNSGLIIINGIYHSRIGIVAVISISINRLLMMILVLPVTNNQTGTARKWIIIAICLK